MKIKLIMLGIAMTLLCTSVYGQQEMYKWKNAAGIMQYSQFPPAGVAETRVEKVGGEKKPRTLGDIENSGTIADQADAEVDEEVELTVDESDLGEQVALSGDDALENAEKLAAAEKQRILDEERNICEIATKNLIGLESRPIVRIKDGDDFKILTAEEKEAKLQETRDQIKLYCR